MSETRNACLAVDFGAGSGRVIAGEQLPDGQLRLTEVHRFGNRQVRLGDSLYWDFPALFAEMTEGIAKAVAQGFHILSVGIDTWGVDFGLLTEGGRLLSNPLCYRDSHTAGLPEHLWSDRDEVLAHFAESGIYPISINSLYQLVALKEREPQMFECAATLLFMPDLFAYFLTGEKSCERTIASTSELLLADRPEWNRKLISRLGLPERIFGKIVEPGTVKGHILPDVASRLGIDYDVPVIAAGGHDTACAVYASRLQSGGARQAFISSGTWSLFGMEIPQPVCTPAAYDSAYTNEGAVGGTVRILQNIPGMWILQQLVAKWTSQGTFEGYDKLIADAEAATIDSLIDVDDPAFVAPADMALAIAGYCREHGLAVPSAPAEYARVAIRSLARRYGKAIDGLNAILPADERPTRINIVGGGSRNTFLNRLTAEATGLEVLAGPVEATAIGSLALQFRTLGLTEA